MQTTERPPTGPSRGSSPVRGVVLVAVAVVLGFFLLRAIDDTGGGADVGDDDAATDTSASGGDAGTDGGGAPTETTAPPARTPDQVIVLVANASGVSGAAAEQTAALQAGGYQVAEPTNAPANVEATQVLPTAGFEAEAAVLAASIGAPEGAVQPMPDPPPLDLAGANILVMLGPDLASAG
jgi:LytR cell envelope-related transcriptional attenuator